MLTISRAQRTRLWPSARLRGGGITSPPPAQAHLSPPSARHLRHHLPFLLRRSFTQRSQLLLISRVPLRAELPYLYASPLRRAVVQGQQGFSQLSFRDRLFTLREVRTWRDFIFTAFQAVLLTTVGWTLWQCVSYAHHEDGMETAHPTPHSWSFRSRSALRRALAAEDSVIEGTRVPDWVSVGQLFARAIERLEDKALEGGDITWSLGEGEEILVEGLGRTGLDVSACSEEWRRGYYQALMGAGRAAERYDTTVRDKISGSLFPSEFVVGPSNPDPRPLPPSVAAAAPPREENCEPAGPPPERFYLKVLTTAGFTTGQRLRAALAYADWLRYKGLNDAAHSMHTWAIDIATEGATAAAAANGFPNENIAALVDRETGVLDSRLRFATDNILLASESMGSHFALAGDFVRALPAYLSVLRAQQTLPETAPQPSIQATPPSAQISSPSNSEKSDSFMTRTWHAFYPPYPAPPPSGDAPSLRSPDTVCASATTMAHIGELLFASDLEALSADLTSAGSRGLQSSKFASSKTLQPTRAQASGLAWTRQAADLAEATLKSLQAQGAAGANGQRSGVLGGLAVAAGRRHGAGGSQVQARQKRCAECLQMAVDNWAKMVHRFEKAEREAAGTGRREPPTVIGGDRMAEVQAVGRQVAEERTMERTGWGLFWSEKLGLGRAPPDEQEHGGWAAEGRMVRQRARAARVLGRQLGLE